MARKWYYKRDGQAAVFDEAPDPAEGWEDQPYEVHYAIQRGEIKRPVNTNRPVLDDAPNGPNGEVVAPEPGPDEELTDQENLAILKRTELMQIARDAGIKFDMTWTKDQLKQAIIVAMEAE
jgi:hypothetical protein